MIARITNLDFKFSLMRNSLFLFACWVVFFPGFFSGDSFGAVEMARTGNLTNSFTASWALYVRYFSFFGEAIGLLSLLGGLLLVFATTQFTYSIFTKKTAAISSFLMTITPLIWGMGLTLWHDIQMTAGLLLVTAFMVKFRRAEIVSKADISMQLILGSLLLSFRPNGLPTLLVFSVLFFLLTRKKVVFAYLLTAISTTVLITVIGSNLILGMSPINNYFAQEWMRNDISCFANLPQGAGFVEENIPGIGNTETWSSEAACIFLNQAQVTAEEKVLAQEYVPAAWVTLAKQDPLFILSTHMKRNAYLVPLPLDGLPKPPFLHSTIEFENQGIEWAFPSIAEKARAPIRLWNALRGFTAWAGLWSVVTLTLLLALKRRELLAPLLMSISLMGVLFVFAPIPDGRYGLFVLIVGQIALLGKLIEWAQTGSNRRPTD
jgi:hypothetical protein